jgi:hypothetical protein
MFEVVGKSQVFAWSFHFSRLMLTRAQARQPR